MIKKYILTLIAIAFAVWVGFFFGKKEATAPNVPTNDVVDQIATTTAGMPIIKKTTTTVTPKTTNTPILTKDGSYLISYTNYGFNPQMVTIKAGKSVHFVNNSSKAMSITTTDPNSQIFGELNQGKTVGRGGVYDFTFLAQGVWGYMNRNNQTDRGTIVVQ